MTISTYKHILFLSPSFPKDESDTTVLPYFHNYLSALSKSQPELRLTVVCIDYPREKPYYQWHGIDVHSLGSSTYNGYAKPFLWLKGVRLALKIHKQHPVEVVHSLWLGELALVGSLISRLTGASHINTAMGTEVAQKNRYLNLLPLKKIHLNCVSQFQLAILRKRRPKIRAGVIPWGIGTPLTPVVTSNDRPIDILFVGGLNHIKNLPLFFEIMVELKKERPSIIAKIVGCNPLSLDVADLIQKNGLRSNVSYLGEYSNEKTLATMSMSRVLIHTSSYESLGYVFLESLLQGMSIVSRQTGIAKANDRWLIAENKAQFVHSARTLLKSNDFSSQVPHPISETINAYLKQYNGTHAAGRKDVSSVREP